MSQRTVAVGTAALGDSGALTPERDALRSMLEPAVRAAAHGLMTNGELDVSAFRAQVRIACADARRRGVRAEHVLIVMRELWTALSASRDAFPEYGSAPAWGRMVALTLDEYYDPLCPISDAS